MLNDEVIGILGAVLGLGDRVAKLNADTPLLGAIPEFDSMAVVNVLTAVEEHYGVFIDDDEVEAGDFETVGTLTAFVARKLES